MPAAEDPLELDATLRGDLRRLGYEFEADFLARAAPARPGDVDLLSALAMALTRVGRYAEGLEVDRRIVAAAPENPTAHYNLACSLALTGELGAALASLATARELGWCDFELARNDEDLAALHGMPEFEALLGDESVDD
ncbi:MAG: hypothetical protein R3F34_10065 [Planctomycetota bacterium]